MLKNKFKTLLIIFLMVFVALSPLCFAVEEVKGGTENTPEQVSQSPKTPEENAVEETQKSNENNDSIKKGDQYIIGDNVIIDYVIDGNLFVLAKNVTIKSQVLGNAFIAATSVKVTEQGYISNSLYVAANTAQIDGIVSDIYSACEKIVITGYIYRDLHSAGENIQILGTIGRNASIASENISFEKTETKSSDSRTVEPVTSKKRIIGNLTYISKEEKDINKDFVEGSINYEKKLNITIKINPIFVIITILVLVFAVWGLLKWLAPKFLERSSDLISKKIYKTIGFGLVGVILIPIISILLILGIVTAPVGFLLLAFYFIFVILSEIIFNIALSKFLAKKFNMDSTPKFLLILLIVTLALYGLELIPVCAFIVSLISSFTGIGIIIRNLVSKEYKQ